MLKPQLHNSTTLRPGHRILWPRITPIFVIPDYFHIITRMLNIAIFSFKIAFLQHFPMKELSPKEVFFLNSSQVWFWRLRWKRPKPKFWVVLTPHRISVGLHFRQASYWWTLFLLISRSINLKTTRKTIKIIRYGKCKSDFMSDIF